VTYARLSDFGVGADVVDAEQTKFHAHVDEVAERGDHDILRDDAEGDDFVAAPDPGEGDEVACEEGRHDERVWDGARPLLALLYHTVPCILSSACVTYKVPEPWKGRLVAGQSGSDALLGMHMGKPEKEETLGLSSSAVKKGATLFPTEKTALGSLMRMVGPEAILMLPSSKLRDSMKPLLRPSKNS